MNKLTHLDAHGTARMVDVGDKPETVREARAEAWVRMSAHTLALIESGAVDHRTAMQWAGMTAIPWSPEKRADLAF